MTPVPFSFRVPFSLFSLRSTIRGVALPSVLLAVTASAMAAELDGGAFPTRGILPKEEIGALRFLAEHGQYDGRGVVVAIFDTGVDPGAPGLQATTTGEPKIIDMVDGSGSGDVDTSTIGQAEEGIIEGLTGRKLRLPDAWQNPSGKYHLGLKRGYELFPKRLVERLIQQRRKEWDAQHRQAVTRAQQDLARFEAEQLQADDVSFAQKEQLTELKNRVEVLTELAENYQDPGPIYDCVVFHDGRRWRAAVDTDEDGHLADEKLLTNYRDGREYGTFGDENLMNFAVNIYRDGNLLSIVCDCGEHGTHVAGIVAGHFPDHPERNGLAPGAQIVSVKIGDSRLGSNSTNTGSVRGLAAVLRNKCDLINRSYGGSTADPNRGRIDELYRQIVNRHGVIFVASAGNSGPALGTVASPGGTNSAILGVGAYVSPAMMQAAYSLRQTLPEMPYSWTSRGPTADGALGVDLSAPGGAIASAPNWSLRPGVLMNGTSMSSPNACGGIALLLSALKAEGVAYTPHSVRRALLNTTRPIEGGDGFSHGQGLVQIDLAYQHLLEHRDAPGERLRFRVTLPERRDARGLYLRDAAQVSAPGEVKVRVEPMFHEDADRRQRAKFELPIKLQSSADWVESAEHLVLNGRREFEIRVDPRDLPEGVSQATVAGLDAEGPERGPLFRLPITVIRPAEVDHDEGGRPRWQESLGFEPGQIRRRFFRVPEGATWADLRVRSIDAATPKRLIVHAVQTPPRTGIGRGDNRHYVTLRSGQQSLRSFAVTGRHTLELCLAQNWSSLGSSRFDFELTFHGLHPREQALGLDGNLLSTRVEVVATLADERFQPEAKLDRLRRTVQPSQSVLRPLTGERDRLPHGRQIHELVLSYRFELDESAEITPRTALDFHDESWQSWESKLWMVFDQGKQRVGAGAGARRAKLKKGPHTLRYHVRHDDPAALQKLKEMPLLLDIPLPETVKLPCYDDPDDLLADENKLTDRTLLQGERAVFYVGRPAAEKLPKWAAAGELLLGEITFGHDSGDRPGQGHRPDGYRLHMRVPQEPDARVDADQNEQAEDEGERSPTLAEKLLQTKIEHLAQLRETGRQEEFDALSAELLQQKPDHLPVLVERLKMLDRDDRKQRLPQIVRAADRILEQINTKKLARYFGRKISAEQAETSRHQRMQQQREILADTLYRKGRAIAFMDLPPKPGHDPEPVAKFPDQESRRTKLFEKNFRELARWVDTTDAKYILLHLRRERRHARQATALRLLDEHIKKSPPEYLHNRKRRDMYRELGWEHAFDYENRWLLIRFPDRYPPF